MCWDPQVPGRKVRLCDNPGRQGVTTGNTRTVGSFLLVEVDFGPAENVFKRYDLLEPVPEEEEMFDLLVEGRFGGPADLRRVLTFEKVKGNLTNVFYSMEASNTDFYPHQFKPVLKFIESPVGRLLIADEVGLGKTIEAMYIWKELQAREQARRLLVVCPAMLREKWRSDLRNRFNIAAEVVTAGTLLQKVEDIAKGDRNAAFVCITSLEGVRPPVGFEDEKEPNVRARLARLLDQHTATEEFALFDLVILDEAHYLRNPATASNRLGRLLRDAAHHLVLLTATPIQIGSDNLYQLLRLIDPDEFYDSTVFGQMLEANRPIVLARRSLWRVPPDLETAARAIGEARENEYFREDPVLERIAGQVNKAGRDPETRVELVRLLESRSLLGQYMARSRKREVLERKVERAAQVLQVRFSNIERDIYARVTKNIRNQSMGKSGISLFSLIMRQRQMASSLVAALESWQDGGLMEELLWEDLGVSSLGGTGSAAETELERFVVEAGIEADLEALERADGKYRRLREFLTQRLAANPREKFVVFAFFRGTLRYLERRLRQDGIRTALIMGAMGDRTDTILEEFRRSDGASVLLSSEVGSEGIDLEFCRYLVNYDLPWNPMKVEQRIGRLDRLGQIAERISIINLVVEDTIEDLMLLRLYDRIKVFEESIGDLEEILGEMTEKLLPELLHPNLGEEERQRRLEQVEMAILNRRREQELLEKEAVNLIGFADYILDHISRSREQGRWLGGEELLSFVEDFFAEQYPGSKIERHPKIRHAARISLSEDAKAALGGFIVNAATATRTRLHLSNVPILCLFDPRQTREFGRDTELIEPTHPLIRWIRDRYEKLGRRLHPTAAIRLDSSYANLPPGDYVFVTHRWSFRGLRSDHILAHRVKRAGSGRVLDPSPSEALVAAAARYGRPLANAANLVGDLSALQVDAKACEEALNQKFGQRLEDFEAENELRCSQQEISARKFAERRIGELRERLERFRAEGKSRPIPMTEGLIRAEEARLTTKLGTIEQRRRVDPDLVPLATGVIRVE